MTLVEALAGTAVLATVLVSILIADGRLRRQAHRAEDRTQACRIADGFLAKLWEDRDEFPRTASGEIPDHPGWSWRTQPVENAAADKLDMQIVALEVFAPQSSLDMPSVHIEILLAEEEL